MKPSKSEKVVDLKQRNADYARGYAAGRKRRIVDNKEAEVRNARATAFAAAIIAEGMRGGWGIKTENGVYKKHDLRGLANMAIREAEYMAREMEVF